MSKFLPKNVRSKPQRHEDTKGDFSIVFGFINQDYRGGNQVFFTRFLPGFVQINHKGTKALRGIFYFFEESW